MEGYTAQPTAASTVLVQSRNAYTQQQQVPDLPATAAAASTTASAGSASASVTASVQKSFCFAPASPAPQAGGRSSAATSSPASGGGSCNGGSPPAHDGNGAAPYPPPSTPKKHQLDAQMLRKIRELLMSPGGCNLHALRLEVEPVNVLKERYLISTVPNNISASAAAKTPVSYRHLIDLSSARLKCTDLYTEEHFLCKIINEPLHKVQMAYFKLQQDSEGFCSQLYGHNLMRAVRDIVPLSKERTYVIIPATVAGVGGAPDTECIYEDLHTYVRNKRRLPEDEARALFYQICQTVQVCHRNGIILRDLKLKRFYFIDADRTKLQYESLEGSMILDDPEDDVLSDKIGCPLYTAPELLCPSPTYNGKPADMWSLGVILYTMLVGQYPFYEKGNCSLIRLIRHGQVQIPGNLSRSVRCLLLNLLRKNYAERIRADYIFLSPWLRKQQMLYVPADIVIPDDIEDMDAEAMSEPLDYSSANMQQQQQQQQPLHHQLEQQHNNNELHYTSSDVEMG